MRPPSLVLLCLIACSPEREHESLPASAPTLDSRVQLVDSVRAEEGPDAVLWHVRIAGDTSAIPGLLVAYHPTLVGDTLVIGVRFDSLGSPKSLFRFDRRTRSMAYSALGPALRQDNSEIAVDPTGDLAASLFIGSDGRAQAQLVRLSDDSVLSRSPSIELFPTDGRFGAAAWAGRDSALVALPLLGPNASGAIHLWTRRSTTTWRIDTVPESAPRSVP